MKPAIPKGTRDFTSSIMMKRNYIFNTIKEVFNLYGYKPIETPAIENLSTLMGKYGEEGDKLIFKIVNSGDFKNTISNFEQSTSVELTNQICEKALRYDLTVPFARFVVLNRNELNFPFKRYQIQPVWRADKPQKGRYREFYQCDVDVVGSKSLLFEYEFIRMIDDVFTKLNLNDITIKLNNRKILYGLVETIGKLEIFTEIVTTLDKIEKIGEENLIKELNILGLDENAINIVLSFVKLSGTNNEKLDKLTNILEKSEVGIVGVNELKEVLLLVNNINLKVAQLQIDISLARGLNYYTGAIFEVKANNVSIGSICGGGRYDNLTEVFGMPDMSGVGISFGADRIFDVMTELNVFPKTIDISTKVLFINFGDESQKLSLKLIDTLRENGISCEVYPENSKIKKQMNYANNNNIPYVIFIGEEEILSAKYKIKDMLSGNENLLKIEEVISFLKQ